MKTTKPSEEADEVETTAEGRTTEDESGVGNGENDGTLPTGCYKLSFLTPKEKRDEKPQQESCTASLTSSVILILLFKTQSGGPWGLKCIPLDLLQQKNSDQRMDLKALKPSSLFMNTAQDSSVS